MIVTIGSGCRYVELNAHGRQVSVELIDAQMEPLLLREGGAEPIKKVTGSWLRIHVHPEQECPSTSNVTINRTQP